jgi:hypothetical protein
LNRRTSLDTVNAGHSRTTGVNEADRHCLTRENYAARNELMDENQQLAWREYYIRGIIALNSIHFCNQSLGFVSENVVNLSNRDLTV